MNYIIFCALAAGMCSAHGAASHTRSRKHARSRAFKSDLCPSKAYESLSVLTPIVEAPMSADAVSLSESMQGIPASDQHAPVAQKPADVGIRALREYTPEEVKVSRQRSTDLILIALGKQQKK